jgi:hypothetical protein
MTRKECEEEERQVRSIVNMVCCKIGFICSSGFDFHDERYEFLDGIDLYNS